jgi:putative sterol carrier protein
VPEFPSDAWVRDFVEAINASDAYAASTSDWEGDVVIAIGAEPDKGVPEDVHVLLDLWHGRCREGAIVDRARGEAAEFLISAPYSRWKDVIEGSLEPVKGLMQGKLKVRGDLQKILRYVRGTQELARLTRNVETTFPVDGPHGR